MARPRVDDRYEIEKMIEIIEAYTNTSPLPILKEVCFQNRWDYQYFMNLQAANPLLRESTKRLLDKKEIELEKGVHAGTLEKTFAIFTLKQPVHGWTDAPQKDADSATINRVLDVLEAVRDQAKALNGKEQ